MKKRQELERVYHRFNDVTVPDPKFNPMQNKAVIEQTMREAEAYHKKVGQALDEALGERIDAVASYGVYRFNKGQMSPETYFGKNFYRKYVGEKLLSKLKVAQSVNKLRRNPKNFVLL